VEKRPIALQGLRGNILYGAIDKSYNRNANKYVEPAHDLSFCCGFHVHIVLSFKVPYRSNDPIQKKQVINRENRGYADWRPSANILMRLLESRPFKGRLSNNG
jgi:hypothetical protein